MECGALEVRRGGTLRRLRGELCRCRDCGALRKATHGPSNTTYSTDGGETWGLIGGKCPPCRGA